MMLALTVMTVLVPPSPEMMRPILCWPTPSPDIISGREPGGGCRGGVGEGGGRGVKTVTNVSITVMTRSHAA